VITIEELVDHAWIDNGRGVLSCIAGSQHSQAAAVVCPYYLRADVVKALAPQLAAHTPSLTWRGDRYVKITRLCTPAHWVRLVAALPADHGLHPMAWSLLTSLDADRWVRVLDPRDALRAALRDGQGPIVALLAQLCIALGDPGNAAGSLGLTGSAALDATRLDASHVETGSDLDLTIYPGADLAAVRAAIATVGGQFPAELPDTDRHRIAYQRSRMMPATSDENSQSVFWRRRQDLAWVDSLRLDLTRSDPAGAATHGPAYTRRPVAGWHAVVTVVAVRDRYPVTLHVDHPDVQRVWITARGYQTTLRRGDRLALRGRLHHPAGEPAFASIDDAAGHQIILIQTGETS
jgi:hypothetical protein